MKYKSKPIAWLSNTKLMLMISVIINILLVSIFVTYKGRVTSVEQQNQDLSYKVDSISKTSDSYSKLASDLQNKNVNLRLWILDLEYDKHDGLKTKIHDRCGNVSEESEELPQQLDCAFDELTKATIVRNISR